MRVFKEFDEDSSKHSKRKTYSDSTGREMIFESTDILYLEKKWCVFQAEVFLLCTT